MNNLNLNSLIRNSARALAFSLTLAFLTSGGSAQDQTVPVPELETLKKEYASLVTAADEQYLAAVVGVKKKYFTRLEQEQQTAQQAGKLDESMAIEGVKEAILADIGVPAVDEAKIPVVLKQMHATYCAEIAKLEQERDKLRARNLKPSRGDYAKKLDSLVMRLTKDGKLQEAMTVKNFREGLPEATEDFKDSALKKKCKLYWSCADDADVYLNGKPLKKYLPDFRTRGDEAGQVFTTESTVSKGDVITVGARRGGSFGFMLVIADKRSKVVRKTDKLNWKSYDPKDKERWYLPKEASKSQRYPVIVNQTPWPPQAGIQKRFKGAESIWTREQDGTAFFVTTID